MKLPQSHLQLALILKLCLLLSAALLAESRPEAHQLVQKLVKNRINIVHFGNDG